MIFPANNGPQVGVESPSSYFTRLALLWLLATAPVFAGTPFLDRLAAVESRGNNDALGQKGERGAWQISRVAWADVDRERARHGLPVYKHTSAHDPVIAREYAASYIAILSRRIRSHGIEPTEDRLCIAWNRGLSIALRTNFDGVNCPKATRRFLTSRSCYPLRNPASQSLGATSANKSR